jgi:hypothetical protein
LSRCASQGYAFCEFAKPDSIGNVITGLHMQTFERKVWPHKSLQAQPCSCTFKAGCGRAGGGGGHVKGRNNHLQKSRRPQTTGSLISSRGCHHTVSNIHAPCHALQLAASPNCCALSLCMHMHTLHQIKT